MTPRTPTAVAPPRVGAARSPAAVLVRLSADQSGSISIVSLFALVLLAFLLGMVINTGRQVDQKLKMQNVADATAFTGSVPIVRGMNALAYTNNLLCDIFAVVAFYREGRDRNAESLTPEILDNWARVAQAFQGSEFQKFDDLGHAIAAKVPLEREMVRAFGEWAAAGSVLTLPVFEQVLQEELIPEYQRALVLATPDLAQTAAAEVANRHGRGWPSAARVHGVLWRTAVVPVGGGSETERWTLPVVDPLLDEGVEDLATYAARARQERRQHARMYLNIWNYTMLRGFDRFGKMSQYSNLWRIFTCGQLEQLLAENANKNLPYQIRTPLDEVADANAHLEQDFTFIGVAYRRRISDQVPRIFTNPVNNDTVTYAQVRMFVPRPRLIRVRPGGGPTPNPIGGVPGEEVNYPPVVDDPSDGSVSGDPLEWIVVREWPARAARDWTLFSQNWTLAMVPAVSPSIPAIISQPPPDSPWTDFQPPALSNLNADDLQWLSHH